METQTRRDEWDEDEDLVGWLRALADDDALDSSQAQTVEDAATEIETLRARNEDLLAALFAARAALRSYEHGNAATDLAAAVADSADGAIARATKGATPNGE